MKIIKNQKKDYTCGLVCVQHAFTKLTHNPITQAKLEELIGTNNGGYSHVELVRLCGMLGLRTETTEGLNKVIKLDQSEERVIILGWTPFYEHYSVFEGIIRTPEGDFVSLNEPDSPSYVAMYNMKDFKKCWKDSDANRWALIITK